jgi:hypothetical protein
MPFEEIMDRIIKARADVLHADRLLAQWYLPSGEIPDANEYTLLVNLIKHANEALDSVVSDMVRESANASEADQRSTSQLIRRPTMNRSRPS